MTGSPYFAAIIVASLFWVTYCWATRLVRGTPGHLVPNAVYIISATLCAYSFYKAVVTDPGYVPKADSDTEVKMVRVVISHSWHEVALTLIDDRGPGR